jgi:hypothetical protein
MEIAIAILVVSVLAFVAWMVFCAKKIKSTTDSMDNMFSRKKRESKSQLPLKVKVPDAWISRPENSRSSALNAMAAASRHEEFRRRRDEADTILLAAVLTQSSEHEHRHHSAQVSSYEPSRSCETESRSSDNSNPDVSSAPCSDTSSY